MINRWGNNGNSDRLFSWASKSLLTVTAAMKLKDACSLEKKNYDQPRQHIKKQTHQFADQGLYSQSYGFSSSHVRCKSWTIKKAEYLRIDNLEL